MDEDLLMDEKMVEEHWMMGLDKQCGRDWLKLWHCIMRVWCLIGIYKLYVLTISCWFICFLFSHMNKNAIGFPSLCLGMSSVSTSSIYKFFVAFECMPLFCSYVLYCGFTKLL